MKSFFLPLIVFCFFCSTAHAQSFDAEEGENFWARYIDPILLYDVDQVVDQTTFPIATYEGDLNEEDFRDLYEIIFDETTLESLSEMDYTSIEVIDSEVGRVCIIAIMTMFEIDEEYYESATILSFEEIDGSWQLFRIDIAG